MRALMRLTFLALVACPVSAKAAGAVACGGVAMLGAAQLMCSHVEPSKPTQFCTYGWTLLSDDGHQKTVEGSFSLPPRAENVQVFQGSGYQRALAEPVVLCQGSK